MPDYLRIDRVVMNWNPVRTSWRAALELRPGAGISFNVSETPGIGLVLEIVGSGSGGSGLVWMGPWDAGTGYSVNDVVEDGGSAYVAINANVNAQPPGADWDLVASKGESGPSNIIHESSGPTSLTVGAVPDGTVLKRVGSTVIGVYISTAITIYSANSVYDVARDEPVVTFQNNINIFAAGAASGPP